MPPLKGEGDRRQAVEGCAPGASVVHLTWSAIHKIRIEPKKEKGVATPPFLD